MLLKQDNQTTTILDKPKTISTKIPILKKNNKKIAKTRRQRGYNWENTIVKR